MEEAHDSNDPNREVGAEGMGENEGGYHMNSNDRDQINKAEAREEELANVMEGEWLGNMGRASPFSGFIDLTEEPGQDPHQIVLYTKSPNEQELIARDLIQTESGNWIEVGQDGFTGEVLEDIGTSARAANRVREFGGSSKVVISHSHDANERAYQIELPEEPEQQHSNQLLQRLDQVTEKELIWTWNDKLSLKRERKENHNLEEVEEELLRSKKHKKEAWYDEEGNLLCITVTSEFGNHTLVVDEQGHLNPQTP